MVYRRLHLTAVTADVAREDVFYREWRYSGLRERVTLTTLSGVKGGGDGELDISLSGAIGTSNDKRKCSRMTRAVMSRIGDPYIFRRAP